jgi:hypothetical protein
MAASKTYVFCMDRQRLVARSLAALGQKELVLAGLELDSVAAFEEVFVVALIPEACAFLA